MLTTVGKVANLDAFDLLHVSLADALLIQLQAAGLGSCQLREHVVLGARQLAPVRRARHVQLGLVVSLQRVEHLLQVSATSICLTYLLHEHV